jgi:hypothetical protein
MAGLGVSEPPLWPYATPKGQREKKKLKLGCLVHGDGSATPKSQRAKKKKKC